MSVTPAPTTKAPGGITVEGHDGASPSEIVIEACRRDNMNLLTELFSSQTDPSHIAHLINTARDGVGNYCLHIAATYGSWETDDVLEELLDQEGVEVDPIDRMDGDTPLHKAIRYVNGLDKADWASAATLAELLVEAGADLRARNKAKLKPIELVDPRNTELRVILQKAEYAEMAGADVVNEDEEEEEGPTGSASDSE
ncbi:hypothetical protein MMC13_003619 [Lambiella insularis]|nr:hypothetical protein [Lambiella insularis]